MSDNVETKKPNGTNQTVENDDELTQNRPADIEADVREMERRKRVENIMNSRLFREELERIIETQINEGSGTSALMQQITDMMGVNRQNNFQKNANCVLPINDIRGIEAAGYTKSEKVLRCKLASVYRLIDLCGWNQGTAGLVTACLDADQQHYLISPHGLMFHEATASCLVKIDLRGKVIEQGTTNFSVNVTAFALHAAIYSSRPDLKCIIHLQTPSVVAVSASKAGLLPISQESVVVGDVATHRVSLDSDDNQYAGLFKDFGPSSKVLLLTNQGAVCCGGTIEETFYIAHNLVLACEAQLKVMPIGLDKIILIDEETRKRIYETARNGPITSSRPGKPSPVTETKLSVGCVEFEALMRMLDNLGFRTGYVYRNPLIKGDVPRPRNDVEVPPAVSSLGYLLEEEELYKKGLWRNIGEGKKGQNRSKWLNSSNQRVEGSDVVAQDTKKTNKWQKIDAFQYVPKNINKVNEFKIKRQSLKDFRFSEQLSSGPKERIIQKLTTEKKTQKLHFGYTHYGDVHQTLKVKRKHAPMPKIPEVVFTDDYVRAYRTTSHFGHPRGSYLLPNPLHFHVVRESRIAEREKPLLVFSSENRRKRKDLGEEASAPLLANQQSQTAYMTNFRRERLNTAELKHTPLCEERILEEMHRAMMEMSLDTEDVDWPFSETDNNELRSFFEQDQYEILQNLSLVEERLNSVMQQINEVTLGTDEGIDMKMSPETSTNSNRNCNKDERIEKFACAIYEHLRSDCFEIDELILFPEVLSDLGSTKLLIKLKSLYEGLYPDGLTDVQKNLTRLAIVESILDKLAKEVVTSPGDHNVDVVSDKIVSITEFVSDLLDKLFDDVSNSNALIEFDPRGDGLCSTPSKTVTSFKLTESTKSGSETFWLTCSSLHDLSKPETTRRVVNVDDIPLRPPDDLVAFQDDESGGGDGLHVSLKRSTKCAKRIEDEFSSDDEGDWMGYEMAKF